MIQEGAAPASSQPIRSTSSLANSPKPHPPIPSANEAHTTPVRGNPRAGKLAVRRGVLRGAAPPQEGEVVFFFCPPQTDIRCRAKFETGCRELIPRASAVGSGPP